MFTMYRYMPDKTIKKYKGIINTKLRIVVNGKGM